MLRSIAKLNAKGLINLLPKKVYVYNPLKSSLCKLFSRKEIITALKEWRHRNVIENEMADIYDGCVCGKNSLLQESIFQSQTIVV